jgi:hypothetical protein
MAAGGVIACDAPRHPWPPLYLAMPKDGWTRWCCAEGTERKK